MSSKLIFLILLLPGCSICDGVEAEISPNILFELLKVVSDTVNPGSNCSAFQIQHLSQDLLSAITQLLSNLKKYISGQSTLEDLNGLKRSLNMVEADFIHTSNCLTKPGRIAVNFVITKLKEAIAAHPLAR